MSDKELKTCEAQAKLRRNRDDCLETYIERKAIKEPERKAEKETYVMDNLDKHDININGNNIHIYFSDKTNVYGWIKKKNANGFEMSKFVLSCKSKNFIEKETIFFNDKGVVTSRQKTDANKFKIIEPETISESLYDNVCYGQ
ncbi:hypothetical protein [Citrobacter werkmanii]|uniref:hypothetical protein n=1 Tax=Citrobacter werkmanii TaxID=67827 RepID=UPI002650C0DB|nr:hypothetical protein [Citrobacter werkmanii]MDN8558380.1 hypothetical protein [Citrobacter werkmanii]